MALSLLNHTLSALITANHILHYNHLVDAFGHISVRNPLNNNTLFLARNLPAALVASPSDIGEYHIEDGSPVDPNIGPGFLEIFIHSEILKRFPDINCVIHSHSEPIISYGLTDVPLESGYHMAGFLGDRVPVFDIAQFYTPSDFQDLLVRNSRFGAALASYFKDALSSTSNTSQTLPDHTTVLMRRHGFATAGVSIEEATYYAMYTQSDARVQTSAITIAGLAGTNGQPWENDRGKVHFLTTKQRADCWTANKQYASRAWLLWVREVENALGSLYHNSIGSPIPSGL